MKPIKYIKCPRCELNYINSRQKLCDVCKKELDKKGSGFADLEELEQYICPVCKTSLREFKNKGVFVFAIA